MGVFLLLKELKSLPAYQWEEGFNEDLLGAGEWSQIWRKSLFK